MNEQLFIEEHLPKELSKEALIEHFKKYKSGCFESRDLLIIHNVRLVYYHIYRNYNDKNYDKKELISIGIIGLIKAVDTYELNKNEFSTYAIKCINNEILNSFKKKKIATTSIEEVIYKDKNDDEMKLGDTISDPKINLVENYEKKELYVALRKYIELLDDINKQIVKLYFGFVDGKRYKQIEISEMLGINTERIRRKLKRSLLIIKENMVKDELIENFSYKTDTEKKKPKPDSNKKSNKSSDRHKKALINKIFNKQIENLLEDDIEEIFLLIKMYVEQLEDEKSKNILKLFYGFYDDKEYSYEEIINQIYLSKENIAKIIQRSTDKMICYFINCGIIDNNYQLNREKLSKTYTKRI